MTLDIEYQRSLTRYVEKGIAPGSYVAAVIANDLLTAVARTDDLKQLRELCFYIAEHFPTEAYGSYQKMNDYIKARYERQVT